MLCACDHPERVIMGFRRTCAHRSAANPYASPTAFDAVVVLAHLAGWHDCIHRSSENLTMTGKRHSTTSTPNAQGYDVAAHVLACFGGAGGQHACAIATALGMHTIFVHRYAGILSAVGALHLKPIRAGLWTGVAFSAGGCC